MVVIQGFTQSPEPVRRHSVPTHTDCVYDVFDDDRRGRVLELSTTGSEDRVVTNKRSQTIQLDKAAALTLLGLMEEVFGTDRLNETQDGETAVLGAKRPEIEDTPPVDLQWTTGESIVFPGVHRGHLQAPPPAMPRHAETADGTSTDTTGARHRRAKQSIAVNRAIETSAVELVRRVLERQGWACLDRQQDGVGYDLEFRKSGQLRKVEIKGIRGDRLEFNVTLREFLCAQNDHEFVLAAVTSALDERKRRIHVLSREDVVLAHGGLKRSGSHLI